MDKQSKKEEHIIKNLIDQAGLEKPSSAFRQTLMDRIEAKGVHKTSYTPLIPAKGWVLMAVFVVAGIGGLYYYPTGILEQSQLTSTMTDISVRIPEISISKTFTYGVLFLSLFILQIPLLKRYMEQRLKP